jgi:hypothetical protein
VVVVTVPLTTSIPEGTETVAPEDDDEEVVVVVVVVEEVVAAAEEAWDMR